MRAKTFPAVPAERLPVTSLPGVGPQRAAAYAEVGIQTLADLLGHPPRRYQRFDAPVPVAALEQGVRSTVRGSVQRCQAGRRGRRSATRLWVADASGTLAAVVFGPQYLAQRFHQGDELLLEGELREYRGKPVFRVRTLLPADEAASAPAEVLRVVYALPPAVPARVHRRCLRAALERTEQRLRTRLPRAALLGRACPSLWELYRSLHFPRDLEEAARARRVLVLEEAVRLQRGLLRLRLWRTLRREPPLADVPACAARYRAALPFPLSSSQAAALEEIARDLAAPRAMSRLLTGDVGSGKTVVALFPLLAAARAGRQGALLVPTEILARQHAATLAVLLEKFGLPPPRVLTRSAGGGPARLDARSHPVVVGTHRLLAQPVHFESLSTVVVDEQHKFGVRQRFVLWDKGRRPDLLLVSATPIPRTLALTLFGHMDVSTLEQREDSRRRVTTEVIEGEARHAVAGRIAEEVRRGGRVFVVCPAIGSEEPEEDEDQRPKMVTTKEVSRWLGRHLQGTSDVAVLHGKLEGGAKQEILEGFAAGRPAVLVATVVVEVGIDVPDASLAVVLGAERFGLSQLHQIRGRIGRRGQEAACWVVPAADSAAARERLELFAATDDGFRLAEHDLRSRGPGELVGMRQHGLFHCHYAEVASDPELLALARVLARAPQDCKSLPVKDFGHDGVASPRWIW